MIPIPPFPSGWLFLPDGDKGTEIDPILAILIIIIIVCLGTIFWILIYRALKRI